jgi:dihydroxy-acid dehydratase
MKDKFRSYTITKGVARSPNRSMLRAIGYQDADFDKPIVGIANGHSTMNPCNAGIQPLADAADAAARRAGAMPQMFGTITVTDGISMGTEGMKYSLVSREVIADAIETATQSQFMDGVLAIGGCDKNLPGAMIGILRMNIPAICVYGGTIKPGHHKGQDLQIVSVFESVGSFTAGKMSKEDFECIERKALPGVGACGGMYTANTMSSSVEAVGMSLPFSSTMAAEDEEKRESAAKEHGSAGRGGEEEPAAQGHRDAQVDRERRGRDHGDRRIDQRRPALARHRACGGIKWTLDDFERVRRKVPVLCDLKPSGRYVAVDLHKAGGVPQVMKMLLAHGLLHGDCMTITGKTVAENLKDVPDDRARIRTSFVPGRTRCMRRDTSRSSGATSPPRGAWRRSRASRRPRSRAPRACSIPSPPRWRRSSRTASSPATSSSSATRARRAAPACARCSRPPRR